METTINTYDSLQVGDTFSLTRVITAEEVRAYADLTGDDNPLHLDEAAAKEKGFDKPIVHGMLLLGYVSKILGRDFPGPGCVAVNINCRFLRPVLVGSEVRFEVRVSEKLERHKHIKMRVSAYLGKKMSVGGEATIIPPSGEEG